MPFAAVKPGNVLSDGVVGDAYICKYGRACQSRDARCDTKTPLAVTFPNEGECAQEKKLSCKLPLRREGVSKAIEDA